MSTRLKLVVLTPAGTYSGILVAALSMLWLTVGRSTAEELTYPAQPDATVLPGGAENTDSTVTTPDPMHPSTGSPGENWGKPVNDTAWFGSLDCEQLEYRLQPGHDTVAWDVTGWYGGDFNRLWLKSEGEWRVSGDHGGDADTQALYGRLISPFWDLQVGVREFQYAESGANRSRWYSVLGLQGLSRYWFDVESAIFVNRLGKVSVQVTATYDLLISQRLILQPRFDLTAAIQSDPDIGVGKGFNSIGLGLRLRYEFTRVLAPYVGITSLSRDGQTADLARHSGQHPDDFALLGGLRIWF